MGIYDDVHAALVAADVAYVVVGGAAVVLQGHVRSTVDLDLVLGLSTPNVRAAVGALTALGFLPRVPVPAEAFADPEQRERWAQEKNMQVFSLYDPASPLRELDLFVREPVPFTALLRDARVVDVSGTPVRVASVDHLIAMKTAAGRPQDLADIAALRALHRGGDR